MNEKYTRWKGNGEVLDVFAKHSIRREREYGCIMEQSIRIQLSVCIQTKMDIHDQIPIVKVVEKVEKIGRIQCFSFDPFHLY